MLAGGCDPLYIARRALRMASEDIGNADPRALTMTLEACAVYERLGSPEGELAIAQAIVFMACAAKSNAVYTAYNAATADATSLGIARSAAASAQRTHPLDERNRLRQGLSLRARRPGGYAAASATFRTICRTAATMCPWLADSRSRSARR